jgi:RimJ/RimL family protein N-acetyltransferase
MMERRNGARKTPMVRALAEEASEIVGYFYAWWRGDAQPVLAPPPGIVMAPSRNADDVAAAMGTGSDSVRERMQRDHQPWLMWMGDHPIGWGWVATSEAAIAELGVTLTLPPGHRYLWDFVILPAWRGRGLYPALLRTILSEEEATRFWIGHDAGNTASARGIAKAGFRKVGSVRRTTQDRLVFVPQGPSERALAAASLLGLPVTNG